MPALDDKIAEVRRLRKVQEVQQLRAQQDAPPAAAQTPQDDGSWEASAARGLSDVGMLGMEAVGNASNFIDTYSPLGAAANSAIAAKQAGMSPGEAFSQQYGRPPAQAPSNRDIAANAGFSEEEFPIPLISNPFTGEHYKTSPAAIAGGVYGTLKDPLTYLPGIGEAKALEKVPEVAEGVGNFARERAVKAATGESKPALKKIAKVGTNMSNADQALANIRERGGTLLEKDPNFGDKPAVGWLSNARGIGETAAVRRDAYGQRIGAIAPAVDRLNPGAITPDMVSRDVGEMQRGLANVGDERRPRQMLGDEAERLKRPWMAEDEQGPPPPLDFASAQRLKGKYNYTPMAADTVVSSQDATNGIKRIIGQHMDRAVDVAGANPAATPEEVAKLAGYGADKARYGTYDTVADAGANQAMNTLNRNMLSPSSKLIGAAKYFKGGNPVTSALAAGANQVALSRGNAFMARAADAVSRKILENRGMYQKWLPAMQAAAGAGSASVVGLHHQLMETDPDYRRLITQPDPNQPAEEH